MVVTALLLVLASLFLLLAYRLRGERDSVRPDPHCSIDQAWEHYVSEGVGWPAEGRDLARRVLERFSTPELADLRQGLYRLEADVSQAENPLPLLREAIMDSADQVVLTLAVGGPALTDPEANDEQYRALQNNYLLSAFRAGVLRSFAALRYGDFSREDWFPHYLEVAEMNARNVVDMMEKTSRGLPPLIETALHERLTEMMKNTRSFLKAYPPRTAVRERF